MKLIRKIEKKVITISAATLIVSLFAGILAFAVKEMDKLDKYLSTSPDPAIGIVLAVIVAIVAITSCFYSEAAEKYGF